MTAPDRTHHASPALSAAARLFLAPPRFAVVASLNPDGSPLQAVVWYALEGDAIVFNSRVGRQWPTNIGHDRRVSLTVCDGYEYVDIRGVVEIDDDPVRGQEVIAGLARRYRENPAKIEEQIAGFSKQSRVTFTLRPTSVFERLSGQ
jgi:PPOX class probable F420-dependent enzyme